MEKYGYKIWFLPPKYHCELAGEGIESMWGFVKWIYCRIPKMEKATKHDFIECVERLLTQNAVSRERISRFFRQG